MFHGWESSGGVGFEFDVCVTATGGGLALSSVSLPVSSDRSVSVGSADSQCDLPVAQFHGTADEFVPFEQGQRLFQAAAELSSTGVAKRFIKIPGGQHNSISTMELHAALSQLLGEIE
jgi:fermentation-respiration switch protein FrsA (DUF1100 family)